MVSTDLAVLFSNRLDRCLFGLMVSNWPPKDGPDLIGWGLETYLLSGLRFSTAVCVWLVVRMETSSPLGPVVVEMTSYSKQEQETQAHTSNLINQPALIFCLCFYEHFELFTVSLMPYRCNIK